MRYEFSFTGEKNCPKPIGVVCGEVLSSGSMEPSSLQLHFQDKQANSKTKERISFQRMSRSCEY